MKENSVQLIGYVGGSPTVKTFESGLKKVHLRVATHQLKEKENALKKFITVWHDVVAWKSVAEYAERSFVKGSRILVDGSIVYRTYEDRQGHVRYVTEIKAEHLMNLDR